MRRKSKYFLFTLLPVLSWLAWETQPAAKAENEYSRFLSESLVTQPRSWDGLSLGSQLMSF